MAKFQRHVFVCINERDPSDARGCCSAKGGRDVAEAFKHALYARGLKRVVRANKSGCLDQCHLGVSVVVYPEAVWYGGVRPEDVEQIVEEHLLGGTPVQRLVVPDDRLTGREPAADPKPEGERA